MSSKAEFKKFAEECLRWSRNAKTEEERQALIELANTWLYAAATRGTPSTPVTSPSEAAPAPQPAEHQTAPPATVSDASDHQA